MVSQIITSLGTAVAACFEWLSTFFNSVGALSLFITVVIILLVYRFLLRPIMGVSAGSDSAKPSKSKGEK